jgi:hypothetical protein
MHPVEARVGPLERAQQAIEAAERLLERPGAESGGQVVERLEEAIIALAQLESDLRGGWRPADPAALRLRLAKWRARLNTVGALVDNAGRLHGARLERLGRLGGYDSSGRCAIPITAARLAVEA